MPPRLDTLIDLELDRLGWSSTTAPEGSLTLDCWLVETPEDEDPPGVYQQLVSLHEDEEVTLCHGALLLRTLRLLDAPIAYEDLWHEIMPYTVDHWDALEDQRQEHALQAGMIPPWCPCCLVRVAPGSPDVRCDECQALSAEVSA
jgi:hypothetical protein